MKKLVATFTAVVLGFSFVVNAGEKAAAKEKEGVKVVKVDEKKDLDVYFLWLTLCSEFRDKKISKGVVKFKDFQVIVKCEFNK